MEQLAVAPLNDMLISLTSLSALLATSNTTSTYSSLPAIISSLTTADDNLTSTLSLLHQHQSNYARILDLRTKADELDGEIKSIVRKADTLRTEIGQVNGDILHDEDDEKEPNDVDYEILLAFAARIGKHNSLAAQEAERESERRALESRSGPNNQSTEPTNDDIARQKADMDVGIAQQRAAMGIAFPDNIMLRLGALGRLQMLREGDRGEAAVDDEIERLVMETEAVAKPQRSRSEVEREEQERLERERRDREWREREAAKRKAAAAKKAKEGGAKKVAKPDTKKTLSLDFEDSDDDEED